jgi:hypothetical protein
MKITYTFLAFNAKQGWLNNADDVYLLKSNNIGQHGLRDFVRKYILISIGWEN